MGERIITADEARQLREGADPGPYSYSCDGIIWPTREDAADAVGCVSPRLVPEESHGTGALLAASWDLALTVEHLSALLAVERGDETRAPAGWARYGDSGWRHLDGTVIQRFHRGDLDTWERRGLLDGDPRRGPWSCALQAMEAIDAERGVSHA